MCHRTHQSHLAGLAVETRRARGKGTGGCPRWSRRVRRQARLQPGNFYRADGRRESGPNQRVIKPRISASSKAGPPGTGASRRWGKLPLIAVRGWGPPTREALREWAPRQPPSSPPAVRCQSALQGSGGGGQEGGRLGPFGLSALGFSGYGGKLGEAAKRGLTHTAA